MAGMLTKYGVLLPPVNQGLVHRNLIKLPWVTCRQMTAPATSASPASELAYGGGLCLFSFFRGATQHAANAIPIACRSIMLICIQQVLACWMHSDDVTVRLA